MTEDVIIVGAIVIAVVYIGYANGFGRAQANAAAGTAATNYLDGASFWSSLF